ncbi:unnamed protein product, partial [Mesorhabditis spiculigera]
MRPILLLLALATVALGCWTPPCRGWCRHDSDCPEDSICNGRKCEKWTLDAGKRHSRPACSENDDCPADQQCVAGNCEPIWDTLDANKRHPRPECGEDSDCPADSICVSGSCQKWKMDVATRSRRSDDPHFCRKLRCTDR